MDFKLKQIGTSISSDEIIYPFDLSSSDDLLIHRTKSTCSILTFLNYRNVTPTKLNLSATQIPKPTTFPQLNINKVKVLDSSDQNEKNYLMLNPYMFPDCTLKNIHYIKCELSPFAERTGYILACLTSSGMIELFNYNSESSELNKIDVNISELRKNSLKNLPNEITKFNVLYSSLNEISFINFEWCAIPFDDHKLLICVTKSDNVIFYQIQGETVVEIKSIKIEDSSKNKLKWMDLNDQHYLLASTEKGQLIRYIVDLTDDGDINDIQLLDVIEGKLKMPINFISIDYHETSAIILCCKGHTLEIFHATENKTDLVCSKYIDMTITGITACDNLEYLICTLNSKVYYVQLQKDLTACRFCNKLDFAFSDEIEGGYANNALYGIATSKNNVLIYLSCFPQYAFDHLVNKQPSHISINLFTKYDPLDIIVNNPTNKFTDYVDCVEAIRFVGFGKFEKLVRLEQMDYDINLNQKFLYYLKVQLLVISIKLIYYQMKSRNIHEIIVETRESIRELILVINGHLVIESILKAANTLTDAHFKVLRSLRKMILKYCSTEVSKEPFITALNVLKPQLMKTLQRCDEKLKTQNLSPEICDFCGQSIDDDALKCSSGHEMNRRCIATNMTVPLDCNNSCRQCKECVSSLEILSSLMDAQSNIDLMLCPLCDLKLVLNE